MVMNVPPRARLSTWETWSPFAPSTPEVDRDLL
jgi:hypothetical protein